MSNETAPHPTPDPFAGLSIPELGTTEDVAALAGVNPATVRWWRHVGRGPRGFRLAGSKRTYYARADVLAWLAESRERDLSA